MFRRSKSALTFFAKVLAIYGIWFVIYDLWLLPDGRLDAWLSMNVAQMAGGVLSAFGFEATVSGRVVMAPGVPGIEVVNGCNGLATIGLFVGFVVAYPGTWSRRAIFLPAGILVIYLTNVVRAAVMLWIQDVWPAAFEPLHSFGLTTIFYVVVFALWVVWANYSGAQASELKAAAAA